MRVLALWAVLLRLAPATCSEERGGPQEPEAAGWLARAAVGEPLLQGLAQALADAEQRLPQHLVRAPRSYGDDVPPALHAATYLHEELRARWPELLEELHKLAVRADSEAGWSVAAGGRRPLHLRCAAVLEYEPAKEAGGGGLEGGWHDDGQTVVTLVLPLSHPGEDFEGGEIEVRVNSSDHSEAPPPWRASPGRGDAVAWRGWHEHRVRPVTRGKRRVFASEWWLDARAPPPDARPADSVDGLREVLALDPRSPVLQLSLALALQHAGETQEASSFFASAASLAPSWERAQGELGAALAVAGRREEAEVAFRAAAGLRPSSARAHVGLSQLALDRGDRPAAVAHLQDARRANPVDPAVHSRLGELLVQESPKEAEVHFQEAVRLAPWAPGPHHRLGLFQAEAGNLGAAEASFRESIRLDPQSPAHFDLGVLLASKGLAKSAAESYRAAIRADPTDVRPHVNLGILFAEAEQFEAAERRFRAALRIAPNDLKALQQLAEVQIDMEDRAAAVQTLERAIKAHPKEGRLRLRMGLLLREMRADSLEVLEHLKAATRLSPDDGEAHYNLGLYHDSLGDEEEAIAAFKAALALSPGDEECKQRLQALTDPDEEESASGPQPLYNLGGGEPPDDSLFDEDEEL